MEKSGIAQTVSNSVEDFSEYADAEESISAPTELLAEFLHSVMVKDYEKALEYCTQILRYEPDYATVKEFRPLIEEKLEMLRDQESEDGSSNSSLGYSSSTSDSLENLRSIKNEKNWETGNKHCSGLESDEEKNEATGTCNRSASQSDIANGNTGIKCLSPNTKSFIRNHSTKEINTSETRTILNAKLLAHQTQTRVLRRENTEDNQNNDLNNLKNENPPTLLHSTNTRVLKKDKSLSPAKDNNSRTFAWFSSLQENIFGNKKRGNPSTKNSVQQPTSTNSISKGKKMVKSGKGTQNKRPVKTENNTDLQ